MDNAIITFIITFLIVLIFNFVGHRIIVNNGKAFDKKSITILLAQSLVITIILSFI
ncbi:hypothetical protein J2S77_001443 [Alkalibacillus salilacus]|uniref:Uncharacterized protein n=1 Tax=Alkalibacillus salilacus TaxID=284582 RepID=A0ABT9VEW1_9BACI|nr:hypothetical protein [Alkalibacillus salilacus]